jgi:hypothetical protein
MTLPREKDGETRRRFAQALAAGGIAESLASPARADQPVAGPIARLLYDAPKLKDVLSDQRMEIIESSIQFVRWALGFILGAAEHGYPELATKGAVVRGASDRLSRSRRVRRSEDTLDNAWKEYGCVSHLWLVDRLIGEAGFEQCADPEKLRVFLAAAEDLRRRGEAWRPKRRGEPILNPGTSWKVPSDFALPAVELVSLPPPTAADLLMVSRGKIRPGE